MTITALPDVTPLGTDRNDDDLFHIVCCDPARALCGADVEDDPWIDGDADGEQCSVCAAREGYESCGARFCRLRSAWLRWRHG